MEPTEHQGQVPLGIRISSGEPKVRRVSGGYELIALLNRICFGLYGFREEVLQQKRRGA
jgi:hypothetical protein